MRHVKRLELLALLLLLLLLALLDLREVQYDLSLRQEYNMTLFPRLGWNGLDEVMVAHYGLFKRHHLLLSTFSFQAEDTGDFMRQVHHEVQSIPIVVDSVIKS